MKWLKVLALALVVGAGSSLFFTARSGVESDLFALIGSAAGGEELKSAASAMAHSASFLVKADSEDAARDRLASLGAIDSNAQTLKHSNASDPHPSTILKSLAPYARCFLSPETRKLLEKGEFAAVRDAAAARLFSPMPPVLPPDRDPFLLFTDYVMDVSTPKGEWVAVRTEMTPEEASAALAAVKGADDVRCAGAPFHTAVVSERSKREINILSVISLFCVILFGWMLTRSFRFLPVLAATLAAAFCVAAAALFAVFPRPHLMTFVFGTSLIGLSVDYVYHAWTARESIAKPLTFSFLSTAACFAPLFFSGVGVLSQMALFTAAGLAAVYVGVVVSGRGDGVFECLSGECLSERRSGGGCLGERRSSGGRRGSFRVAAYVLFALCIAGMARVRFDDDLSRFHRPDPYLAKGEMMAAEISGGEGFVPSVGAQLRNAELVRRLYAAEGKAYCEMTGLPQSVLALPAKDVAFDPRGGLENVFARLTRKLRAVLLLTYGAIALLLGAISLLLRCPPLRRRIGGTAGARLGGSGVAMCFHSAAMAAFATIGLLGWIGEPITFFHLLCVFIFFGLGLDYSIFSWHSRRRCSCGLHSLPLTPSLEGGRLPHATDGKCPASDSLLLTPSLEITTGRAVRYSFLTSFVGFGLLAFTDFAVTRSMGITLAVGLAFSYLAAKLFCGNTSPTACLPWNDSRLPAGGRGPAANGQDPVLHVSHPSTPDPQPSTLNPQPSIPNSQPPTPNSQLSTPWHKQREQCASRFWALFMWYSYAWFGKTFQKAIFVIGMPFIYLFAGPPRLALTKFYAVLSAYAGRPHLATHGRLFRHILGFAWGVMDKTDACTLKKNPPQMDVRDDEGWRALKGLVDSGRGAFLLCTHVGTIGVLPALPDSLSEVSERPGGCGIGLRIPKVHAFQQMGHDAVFMEVFMKHFDPSKIRLHAVEEIGVETAVEMQDAIRRGELVIMAGDRTSAGSKSVLHRRFLGRDCAWPKGAFRFAELMEAPVFGVTCVRTGWNRYEVHVAELGAGEAPAKRRTDALLADYVRFLEAETLAHPEQWYQFYDFFGGEGGGVVASG